MRLALFILPLVVSQAFAVRPNVIYGDDDRRDYYAVESRAVQSASEATVALMRAATLTDKGLTTEIASQPYGSGMGLCPTERFYEQETAAFCSGFLVAPDTIVTAGHCIRSQDACDSTRFVFGFRLEVPGAQPRAIPSEHVFRCRRLVHTVSNSDGEDFAVVKLDRTVDFVKPLAVRASGRPAVGDALTVMGHPAGLPLKVAGGATVRAVRDQFLVANLDTYGGNSGSVVFNSVTGLVEGVLVRGEMDFRYQNGCRTSNVCANGACRGEDVTLFERVLPYLSGN